MGMSMFDTEKLQRMQEKEKEMKKHTIMIVDDEEVQLKSLESLPSNEHNVILMLDVDNIETFTNIYGNEARDMISIQLANLLRKICSESDLAVRWKDDKFLIVNRFTSREQAKSLAERLRLEVNDHIFDLEKVQTKRITCSIGFAPYPFQQTGIDKLDWEEVVNIAEKALYAAKNLGPNTWVGILSTEKTDPDTICQEIGLDDEKLVAKLKKLDESGELKIMTSNQNGLDKKKQDASKLPEGFYKPIKVKRYIKFNREELHRDV